MLYLAAALVVYGFTAVELFRGDPPDSFREALGGALACAVVAAMWPIALVWRGLLGGSRRDPVESAVARTAPSRGEA